MCVRLKRRPHTHTQEVDWGFLLSTTLPANGVGLLLSPITYKCLLGLLCPVRRPSHGLCPIKGQWLGPRSQVRARNQFLSLSLCTTRTTPQYQMLVIHPALYLSSYVLPRDPQGRLTSNKTLNKTVSSKLVGNFISLYPSMTRNPVQPHSVLGRDTRWFRYDQDWFVCKSGDISPNHIWTTYHSMPCGTVAQMGTFF